MILGFQEDTIVKLAVENQNSHFDGVVQYDYETGELYGYSMSQNETENPKNPVIEVFRLQQGEKGEIEYNCDDCIYYDEEVHKKCCMQEYIDNYFDEDFEDNFKQGVEEQISDVIRDHIGELLDKYNIIRIKTLDILNPEEYYNHRNDDWELRTVDSIVDMVLESGFTTGTTAEEYLEGEYYYLMSLVDDSDDEKVTEVYNLLQEEEIDEAIEFLGGE